MHKRSPKQGQVSISTTVILEKQVDFFPEMEGPVKLLRVWFGRDLLIED